MSHDVSETSMSQRRQRAMPPECQGETIQEFQTEMSQECQGEMSQGRKGQIDQGYHEEMSVDIKMRGFRNLPLGSFRDVTLSLCNSRHKNNRFGAKEAFQQDHMIYLIELC